MQTQIKTIFVIELDNREFNLISMGLRGMLKEEDKAEAEALQLEMMHQKLRHMKSQGDAGAKLAENLKKSQ